MTAPITTEQAIAHLAASVPADASDTSRALVALARQVAELRDDLQRTRRQHQNQSQQCWRLTCDVVRAERVAEHRRVQAQTWKQEARTANATIAECYRAVTGGTGEPGNWHGARPVVECIDALRAELAEVHAKFDAMHADLGLAEWDMVDDAILWRKLR